MKFAVPFTGVIVEIDLIKLSSIIINSCCEPSFVFGINTLQLPAASSVGVAQIGFEPKVKTIGFRILWLLIVKLILAEVLALSNQ